MKRLLILLSMMALSSCASTPRTPCADVIGELALYARLKEQGIRVAPQDMAVTREACGYDIDLNPRGFEGTLLRTDEHGKIIWRADGP